MWTKDTALPSVDTNNATISKVWILTAPQLSKMAEKRRRINLKEYTTHQEQDDQQSREYQRRERIQTQCLMDELQTEEIRNQKLKDIKRNLENDKETIIKLIKKKPNTL